MIVVKTVYVKRLPPKNTIIHLNAAISSCSPEEIKKPNPTPDLHYFEMYWFTQAVGGFQKNVLRLLFPTYKMACEEHDVVYKRLYGGTEGWIDEWYDNQITKLKEMLKTAKENKKALQEWDKNYGKNM